jgi:substrate-binding family protein
MVRRRDESAGVDLHRGQPVGPEDLQGLGKRAVVQAGGVGAQLERHDQVPSSGRGPDARDLISSVTVVGYDDSEIARLSFINLTTVRQDAALMAEHAVQAIIERLDHGRTEARDIVLDPSLVVRGTTRPPRSASAST